MSQTRTLQSDSCNWEGGYTSNWPGAKPKKSDQSRRKATKRLDKLDETRVLPSTASNIAPEESLNHKLGALSFDISDPVKPPSTSLKQQTRSFESGYSSGFNSGALLKADDDTMRVFLAHAKDAEPFSRLLSFALVVNCIQMSVTAVKMVNAGFVAMKTTSGFRFGCPDCKIILGDIPDKFDSPQALHKFRSPNCPHVHNAKEEEVAPASNTAPATDGRTDTSMAFDSGLGTSLSSSQSLFTTSHQGASIAGAAAFDEVTADGSQESVTFDVIHTSQKASILRHVELSTQSYRMRRSKLEHSMAVEKNRRKTFKERNSLDTRITKIYASSGLHLTEERKGKLKLICAWCEFSVDFTREMTTDKEIAKELLDKHVMDYHCDFITGREETMRNVPDLFDNECWESLTKHTSLDEADPGDQLSGLQINYQQAKHPGMAVFERRKDSFLTFPTDSTQQPDLLIEAGYFYASGKSDTVTCFMCGIVSSDWSINETPWQRHARTSPKCQHVMSQKGEEFVRSTLEEYGEYRERKRENRIHNVTTRMLRPRMDSIVVQKALLFGIKRDHIKTVVSNRIMAGDPDFTRLEDLTRAVQDLDVPPSHLHADPVHPLPKVICLPNIRSHGEEDDEGISDVEEFVTAELDSMAISGESGIEEQRQLDAKQKQEDLEAIKNFGVDIDIPQLRNQLTCKVCLTEPVGIIYIPCGHFVCCTSCAAAMTHCPMCRKDVNGTIKANFR